MNASLPWVSCGLNTNPDIVFERKNLNDVCFSLSWAGCPRPERTPGSQSASSASSLLTRSQQHRQGRREFVYYIILSITWKHGSQTHCVRAWSMSFRQLQCISTASACSSCQLLRKEASEAHIREAHWLLDAYHHPHAGCTEFLTASHRLPLRIAALLSWFALAYASFWNWLPGNLAQMLQFSRSPLGHHSVFIWFLCVTYV